VKFASSQVSSYVAKELHIMLHLPPLIEPYVRIPRV